MGGKTEQKSIKNRGTNLRAEKSPLGVILGRFRLDFQAVLGSKMLIFHWFLKLFVNINVFDEDWYPRAIRTQKWSKKGAKMAPTWLPKRIKNRSKNMMDFLIDFEAVLEPPGSRGLLWRGGGGGESGGVRPPQKLIAKAISDTIMSSLAN